MWRSVQVDFASMDEAALRSLIDSIRSGATSPDDAVASLRQLPFADLGFARVDHHRTLRQGMAETIYAPGKTAEQCAAIVSELLDAKASPVILSRSNAKQATVCLAAHPEGQVLGHTVVWNPRAAGVGTEPRLLVISAGTADQPVADEVDAVLGAYGYTPTRLNDCGVSGIHRLLAETETIAAADAIVVVAGMEGALASVIGGLTSAPVIAVPTSVGYGSSLEGVTALLGMLSSCASGITVVGIDNGFGAASAIVRMFRLGTSSTGDQADDC